MWPHINNSLYENDFQIKVIRNTCKNHRAGKIRLPSKSNSQVRGCLTQQPSYYLMFFPYSCPWPPAPSARGLLPALLSTCLQRGKRLFQAPGCGLEEAGGAEPPLSVLQRVMQLLRALWPRKNAAVAPGQPAINTLAPAHPDSTGHHRHMFQKEIWLTNTQLEVNTLHLSCEITHSKPCFWIFNQVSPRDYFCAFAPSWKRILAHLTLFPVSF